VVNRRLAILLASMALAMVLFSGVAWAAIQCHAGTVCRGNERSNVMLGSQGRDTMYGLGGHDGMSAEAGADKMYGGPGNEEYIVRGYGK
jgi:Ca2+-binding RTX toxin-like protein